MKYRRVQLKTVTERYKGYKSIERKLRTFHPMFRCSCMSVDVMVCDCQT